MHDKRSQEATRHDHMLDNSTFLGMKATLVVHHGTQLRDRYSLSQHEYRGSFSPFHPTFIILAVSLAGDRFFTHHIANSQEDRMDR
jgi:hypothetical protein